LIVDYPDRMLGLTNITPTMLREVEMTGAVEEPVSGAGKSALNKTQPLEAITWSSSRRRQRPRLPRRGKESGCATPRPSSRLGKPHASGVLVFVPLGLHLVVPWTTHRRYHRSPEFKALSTGGSKGKKKRGPPTTGVTSGRYATWVVLSPSTVVRYLDSPTAIATAQASRVVCQTQAHPARHSRQWARGLGGGPRRGHRQGQGQVCAQTQILNYEQWVRGVRQAGCALATQVWPQPRLTHTAMPCHTMPCLQRSPLATKAGASVR